LGSLLQHRPHLPSPRTRRTPRTRRRVRPLTRLAADNHHQLPTTRPGRPHRPAKGHHQRATRKSHQPKEPPWLTPPRPAPPTKPGSAPHGPCGKRSAVAANAGASLAPNGSLPSFVRTSPPTATLRTSPTSRRLNASSSSADPVRAAGRQRRSPAELGTRQLTYYRKEPRAQPL